MEELLLLVVYYTLMVVSAVVSPVNLTLIADEVSCGLSFSRCPTPALSSP